SPRTTMSLNSALPSPKTRHPDVPEMKLAERRIDDAESDKIISCAVIVPAVIFDADRSLILALVTARSVICCVSIRVAVTEAATDAADSFPARSTAVTFTNRSVVSGISNVPITGMPSDRLAAVAVIRPRRLEADGVNPDDTSAYTFRWLRSDSKLKVPPPDTPRLC